MVAADLPPVATAPPPEGQPPLPPVEIPVGQAQPIPSNLYIAWSTGLFDCFSDIPNCCLTFWCPCITFGQIAEIVDRGSTSCGASGALYALIAYLTNCAWIYSCFYRTKMRRQYRLPESPCPDCLVHFFCESCALCQEYRELQRHGFDMDIGWHANVEKQHREGIQMATPPVVQGGMMR